MKQITPEEFKLLEIVERSSVEGDSIEEILDRLDADELYGYIDPSRMAVLLDSKPLVGIHLKHNAEFRIKKKN